MPTSARSRCTAKLYCATLSADPSGRVWARNLLTEMKQFVELMACKRRDVKSKRVAGDNS